MTLLKPGARLKSAVCDTEVVVVRVPAQDVVLECGGSLMGDEGTGDGPVADHAGGTALGKRYVHEPSGLEVLCVKAGLGSLSVAGTPMTMKQSKKLPSSD